MRKIFAYVGSRNPDSHTLKNTVRILDRITETYPDSFEIELYTPNHMHVAASTGCKTCFNEGYCPLENQGLDQSAELKSKLLAADFIFLASPVYSHNVSSDMKAVVERLSYWGHLFRLAGKSCVVMATADSNGVHFVSDYLEKVANVMGLNVIDKLSISSQSPLRDSYLDGLIEEIYDFAYGIAEIETDDRAELSFQTYKKMYQHLPLTMAEPRYWKESGLFEHPTLQSYIDDLVKKRHQPSHPSV